MNYPLLEKLFKKWGIEKQDVLYLVAKQSLDKDMGDSGYGDDVDCVAALNGIVEKAWGRSLPDRISTYRLEKLLSRSPRWKRIGVPEKGCVILSPSGFRRGPSPVQSGHVGVVGDTISDNPFNVEIMSNDSATGLWKQNYTLKTWYERWFFRGRYPVIFYKPIF